MTAPIPNDHWYHLTPDRFFIGLLAVQVFLLLSERFQWFPFNEHKGWTVLIAVGIVCVAVLVMLVWFLVSLVLRRRFQFGVRSLLVFLVAVSIPLGWFGWQMQKARRQREAVERIRAVDGGVNYDYEYDENGKWSGGEPTAGTWLRTLLGDCFFSEVHSAEPGFLGPNQFDDEDMEHIADLPNLRCLNVASTEVTDAGLCHLGELRHLRRLCLADCNITDDGLTNLQKTASLEDLSLANTRITDDGLGHLKRLTNLRYLGLQSTSVTTGGVKELQEALPKCFVSHYH
jgi:hypothetical protein